MKHFYRVLPAQKGPLMVGKPKKENAPKVHFPGRGAGGGGGGGGGGSSVRDVTCPRLEI